MSEFRKRKLAKVLTTLFDSNNDGVIEEADIQGVLEKFCSNRGWDLGSPEAAQVKAALDKFWNTLREKFDADGDGKVTVAEWIATAVKSSEEVTQFRARFRDMLFNMIDREGDGNLSKDEYVGAFSKFGVDPGALSAAYDKISEGGELSKDRFAHLWNEYFEGEDEGAPGACLFG